MPAPVCLIARVEWPELVRRAGALLGHADPRVSQRYAKLSMPALQAAANTASIIVPKVQLVATPPATPEAAAEPASPQPASTASPEQDSPKETPASNVVPFLKLAA